MGTDQMDKLSTRAECNTSQPVQRRAAERVIGHIRQPDPDRTHNLLNMLRSRQFPRRSDRPDQDMGAYLTRCSSVQAMVCRLASIITNAEAVKRGSWRTEAEKITVIRKESIFPVCPRWRSSIRQEFGLPASSPLMRSFRAEPHRASSISCRPPPCRGSR
jgi:hypothetical protein